MIDKQIKWYCSVSITKGTSLIQISIMNSRSGKCTCISLSSLHKTYIYSFQQLGNILDKLPYIFSGNV